MWYAFTGKYVTVGWVILHYSSHSLPCSKCPILCFIVAFLSVFIDLSFEIFIKFIILLSSIFQKFLYGSLALHFVYHVAFLLLIWQLLLFPWRHQIFVKISCIYPNHFNSACVRANMCVCIRLSFKGFLNSLIALVLEKYERLKQYNLF